MPKTHPITKVSAVSVAKVMAWYYGFWGLVAAIVYHFVDVERWQAPLGIWTLFLDAKLNLYFLAHAGLIATVMHTLELVILYALTGWITGWIGAVIYNLLAKHFGLCILGATEPPSPPRADQS